MSKMGGQLLHEDKLENGKVLYVMDPSVGLDGSFLEDEILGPHSVIAYFSSGHNVRQAGYTLFEFYPNKKFGYVSGINVSANLRRRGIASKMLSLVEKECAKRELERLELCPHTKEGMDTVIANGYDKVGGMYFKKIKI